MEIKNYVINQNSKKYIISYNTIQCNNIYDTYISLSYYTEYQVPGLMV